MIALRLELAHFGKIEEAIPSARLAYILHNQTFKTTQKKWRYKFKAGQLRPIRTGSDFVICTHGLMVWTCHS